MAHIWTSNRSCNCVLHIDTKFNEQMYIHLNGIVYSAKNSNFVFHFIFVFRIAFDITSFICFLCSSLVVTFVICFLSYRKRDRKKITHVQSAAYCVACLTFLLVYWLKKSVSVGEEFISVDFTCVFFYLAISKRHFDKILQNSYVESIFCI